MKQNRFERIAIIMGVSIIAIILFSSNRHLFKKYSWHPLNLSIAKEKVIKYYQQGGYEKEIQQITHRAWGKFKKIPLTEKSTVIFDIDDTVISSYPEAKRVSFGSLIDCSAAWLKEGKAPAINHMLDLYNKLITQGFKIIFITGRRDTEKDITIKNLHEQGFNNFIKIIFRTPEEYHMKAALYKQGARKRLEQEGYDIVGCIGDQMSDCAGEDTGIKIKIPNYMYLTH